MARNILIILLAIAFAGCAHYRAEDTAASKPVSQLDPLGGPPDNTDQFFVNDSGISKSVTALNVIKMLESDRGIEIYPNNLPADGQKAASFLLFDDSEDVVTGDGAADFFWRVPDILNGWSITGVAASNQTAGADSTSGTQTTTIQIYRKRLGGTAVAVLSVPITIEEGDTDSSQATTAASINTSNDDVAAGDTIWFYVTTVTGTTAPKGLITELTFKKL